MKKIEIKLIYYDKVNENNDDDNNNDNYNYNDNYNNYNNYNNI